MVLYVRPFSVFLIIIYNFVKELQLIRTWYQNGKDCKTFLGPVEEQKPTPHGLPEDNFAEGGEADQAPREQDIQLTTIHSRSE